MYIFEDSPGIASIVRSCRAVLGRASRRFLCATCIGGPCTRDLELCAWSRDVNMRPCSRDVHCHCRLLRTIRGRARGRGRTRWGRVIEVDLKRRDTFAEFAHQLRSSDEVGWILTVFSLQKSQKSVPKGTPAEPERVFKNTPSPPAAAPPSNRAQNRIAIRIAIRVSDTRCASRYVSPCASRIAIRHTHRTPDVSALRAPRLAFSFHLFFYLLLEVGWY